MGKLKIHAGDFIKGGNPPSFSSAGVKALAAAFFVVLSACSDSSSVENGVQRRATIKSYAVAPYTPGQYPETYRIWGEAGVARIETLRIAAAELVSRHPECSSIEVVEWSRERSKPTYEPVVWVDCADAKRLIRFFVNEDGVRDGDVFRLPYERYRLPA